MGILKMAEGADLRPGFDDGIAQHAMGVDAGAPAHHAAAVDLARARDLRARFHRGQRADPYQRGRMQHHAGTQQAVHHTPTQTLFAAGKFQGRIDAHQALVPAALHALHLAALGHGQGDEVGDVVFAALVGIADARQQTGRQIQAHAVHARVDLVRFGPVQRGVVVLGLHDGPHAAPGGTHHPAIGGGIVQLDGGKGQVGPCRCLHEVAHHVLGEQWRIAVDHQHTLALSFQRGHGLHQGMARAQLLLLADEGRVREGGLHHARLMAHHHQHAPVEHGADGFQHIAQHGFTQDGLQYFGFVGMHAGALARGQNEGGSLQHGGSLRKRWGENSPSARKGQADGYGGKERPFWPSPPFPLALPFSSPKTFALEDDGRYGRQERTHGRRSPAWGNGSAGSYGHALEGKHCPALVIPTEHKDGQDTKKAAPKGRLCCADHPGRLAGRHAGTVLFRLRRSGRPVRRRARRSGRSDHPGYGR